MLYTALLVATLLIDLAAHNSTGEETTAVMDVKTSKLLKKTLLSKGRVLWKILWDRASILFDETQGFGELKILGHAPASTIQAAIGDCLNSLDKLLYPMH